MIKVGRRIPMVMLHRMTTTGPTDCTTDEVFAGRRVALFGLPCPFTPTCSYIHMPDIIAYTDAFKAKGIDEIECVSVNDAWVLDAWGKHCDIGEKLGMLADGSAKFTRAVGLEYDLVEAGFGVRSRRYSMLVEDRTVKALCVEDGLGIKVSNAATLLGYC